MICLLWLLLLAQAGIAIKSLVLTVVVTARHRFFSIRVVKGWNSLPINVADANAPHSFKKGLTQILGGYLITDANLSDILLTFALGL